MSREGRGGAAGWAFAFAVAVSLASAPNAAWALPELHGAIGFQGLPGQAAPFGNSTTDFDLANGVTFLGPITISFATDDFASLMPGVGTFSDITYDLVVYPCDVRLSVHAEAPHDPKVDVATQR